MTDYFTFRGQANPPALVIAPGGRELLRITSEGEVIAPCLEAASQAGLYFADTVHNHMIENRLHERLLGKQELLAEILEWLRSDPPGDEGVYQGFGGYIADDLYKRWGSLLESTEEKS